MIIKNTSIYFAYNKSSWTNLCFILFYFFPHVDGRYFANVPACWKETDVKIKKTFVWGNTVQPWLRGVNS